jgi:hypothetical protein
MIRPLESALRMACFKVATHTYFEVAVLIAIMLNSIVLCVKWPNIDQKSEDILEKINYFFTAVFLVEAIIKLMAFGGRYFKENWNRFDFLIVFTSLTFILVA